tara:strand:+ start:2138 stop:2545 length:408 start_codon:yes stop_codon:yes gene_type:complete
MPTSLKVMLGVTDLLFLSYWGVSGLYVLGIMNVPESMLYANYHDLRVFAWNWSFLPLDVIFSVTGLMAITAANRGRPWWPSLALISLVLSSAAGGMAISYWIILCEFDPSWFLPNLVLFLWPLFFIRGIFMRMSR